MCFFKIQRLSFWGTISFQARMTTSYFCWVLQATLLQRRVPGMNVRPSPQVGSRPSCRQLCPVQSRAAAANSRATARQHTKRGSLCSNSHPAPLLCSSTAIPFGTDQDMLQTTPRHVYWPGGTHSIFQALLTPSDTGRGDVSLWALTFWEHSTSLFSPTLDNLCRCSWKASVGWPQKPGICHSYWKLHPPGTNRSTWTALAV